MNQLMPELILEEEDDEDEDEDEEETMSEIMFGFASGDNEDEDVEENNRKKRGRPRLLDQDKKDPLCERKDHGNNKKHLCSLCGRTLTGLTAYNRHQVRTNRSTTHKFISFRLKKEE